jgi:arginine/lysine/ornithine decarboxylase
VGKEFYSTAFRLRPFAALRGAAEPRRYAGKSSTKTTASPPHSVFASLDARSMVPWAARSLRSLAVQLLVDTEEANALVNLINIFDYFRNIEVV